MLNNQDNSIPLLESDLNQHADEHVHNSDSSSTYYTNMDQIQGNNNQELQDVSSNVNLVEIVDPPRKETPKEKFIKAWKLVKRLTFGNRRLKVYLLTVAKFFSITFTQANNLFELDKANTDIGLIKSIEIIAYTFMALLILSFTVRFIRESYCAWKVKPLNIVVNFIEAGIFFLYLAFSTATAIIHLVFIGRAAADPVKPYDSTKIGLGVFAVSINYYIILEKAWVYLKASRYSVSLYLVKGTLIPNPNSKHHKKK